MKNQYLMILFIILGSVFYAPVSAQTLSVTAIENAVKKDGKYAMLVSNARYFQAAVRTGETLKGNSKNLDFQVVLIGPVVKELATNGDLKASIEASEKSGIRLVVCEAAMYHFKLKHNDFNESIAFTPDGFIYMFGLQENGFKVITL